MGDNLFKCLREKKRGLGVALIFPSPEVAEIFGQAGWDIIYASMHASRISWDDVAHMVRATYRWGITPAARIPIQPWVGDYNPGLAVDAHHAFGLGARVVIASVSCKREVQELIETQENEYHEISDFRFHDLATQAELEEWKTKLHDETMAIPMIESASSWNDLEGILSVPGLRAAFLGMGDLTRILGVDRQTEHPKTKDAIKKFVDLAKSRGIAAIVNTGYPENIDKAWEITQERAHWLFEMGVDIVFGEPADAFLYGQVRKFAREAKGIPAKS